MAQVLDGAQTMKAIKEELATRVKVLTNRGITPGLGTILVGDDPASASYVRAKHRDCGEIGVASIRRDLPADATQAQVEAAVDALNADPACHAYIVQLPLPKGLDEEAVLERMDPVKDADGLHPLNLGRLALHVSGPVSTPVPCTPRGIIELIVRHGVNLRGSEVCVVGRGITVGRTMGLLLTRKSVNATVTQCHTGTRDLAAAVRRADVVIAAAGVPGLITGDMVRPGATVLDVGVSRVEEEGGRSRLVGDIAPDVAQVAGWISPNPGGVGPMTRAMLLTQVVEAAERLAGIPVEH